MNYLKKIFPVLILSGSLIFVGMYAGSNAEAATTITSLTKTVNSLSAKIKSLQNKVDDLSKCVDDGFKAIKFKSSGEYSIVGGYGSGPRDCEE